MNAAPRRKLIEVALPLEAINHGCQQEKNAFLKGHPRSLHLWWARRPLAACRAVLFASIVDDPSSRPDLFATEEEQQVERQRLFRIIEELVKWENTTNEVLLDAAREEIRKASDGNLPRVLDPFCGGGSIPLEAQRLGLEAYASDLNPVAVLITKALIEIPPKFADNPPVNPEARERLAHGANWKGTQGLVEDVRYYGTWVRDRALERIGHLYPKATLPDGGEATVIAWLWARTVTCPNPACGAVMPLARSFALSRKRGKEWCVEPIIEAGSVRLDIRPGTPTVDGTVSRRGAQCLVCQTAAPLAYVRVEGQAGRMGRQLLAIVAEGQRVKRYLAPDDHHVLTSNDAEPTWRPSGSTPERLTGGTCYGYGLTEWGDLFTQRQLVGLTALGDLVDEARQRIREDAGDEAYADAITTYLACALNQLTRYSCTLCTWNTTNQNVAQAFGRQAVPMVWDFAEANLVDGVLDFSATTEWVAGALQGLRADRSGQVRQLDASAATLDRRGLVCTDPPYYDNIGYADLADFFYVWLRRSLRGLYPDLFSTVLTPKSRELVATPHRFEGDRRAAEQFFEEGLRNAFDNLRDVADTSYPMTLFYAFKQAESTDGAIASTGWDAMLTGLLESGYCVTGTWPVRSERDQGLKSGTNVLASSIVLVCRQRSADAAIATRREIVGALRAELPAALKQLQHGNIAPVDLAQAAIGPGMAIFSRYGKALEADGTSMTVRSALALINQTLDEILAEQEGDFDADTRFAVTWFEQHAFNDGPFGEADVLARAKDTSTRGLEDAGILMSRGGRVRLLRRDELPEDWDPVADRRPTVWEATQHLARRLESDGGEMSAAQLLRRLGGLGETARELAYRLYTTCERKGWAQDALAYNALVVAWPEIARLVAGTPEAEAQQALEI